jgi:hypothetical protein
MIHCNFNKSNKKKGGKQICLRKCLLGTWKQEEFPTSLDRRKCSETN